MPLGFSFPDGRMQALGIAWDSRPKDKGGQRWFHLYPDQKLEAGDPLHWTGIDQSRNFQCVECHSTDLRKNYDAQKNTYATYMSVSFVKHRRDALQQFLWSINISIPSA